jgi:hypothetical protein
MGPQDLKLSVSVPLSTPIVYIYLDKLCYTYNMTNIKPYTYKITNEITGQWYIGKKTANKVPAEEDTTYWGSSKYLKKLMKEVPTGWTKTIIAEYESDDETGLAETILIKEHWDLPGRVNKSKGQGKGVDFSDPNVKAKHLEAHRTPEYRAKRSEIRAKESEEVRKKRQKAATAAKNTSEWKENHVATSHTLEVRAKMSEIQSNRSSEWKENHIAANKERAKVIIATNIFTSEEFEMQGRTEIELYDFDSTAVYNCCKGKYSKTNIYKEHIFRYKS